MSSARTSPRHSRHSSTMDSYTGSPQARRHSKSSMEGPSTPDRGSFNRSDTLDLNQLRSDTMGGANGMGNLADELADAFSDSGDDDEYYDDEQDVAASEVLENGNNDQPTESANGNTTPDTLPKVEEGKSKSASLALPSPHLRNHSRRRSEYDGSEYGSESDLESPGVPPGLVAKMDAVESLARRGTENYGGPADNVFKRVTEGLRDLGSQSSVEASASRLITAHSALTTHLSHQTRQLHNLSFPLLSPLVPQPDSDTIDELMPILLSLSDNMPRPSTSAFNSLTALHSMTSDLVQTLNYLSDTLHMSRQTATTAARRLRSAKELVAEMKREEELREEGERWLTRGSWGERLQKRECAGVCGDVISGFEEVCNGWRERLLAQAESQA